MNKQKILGGIIIVVGMLLAGCSQSVEQKDITTSTKSQVMSEKIATQEPIPRVVWSNRQALALDQFIKKWQKTYKPRRHFLRYFPGVAGSNYLGYSFPQTFSKRNLIYNGGQIKLGISKDGADKYNYNVVAVYSDATDATVKDADHLYIMTIHNGKPLILVDTNVAHPKHGFIYLKVSHNKQLTAAFSQIFYANSKELAALTPDEKWQPITYHGMTFNYRQLGAMLESYMSLSNEKITAIAHEESFSIMHVENGPLKVGYYNLSPKIGYTYNAAQLDMKSNDLVNPQETIPLHDLITATYRTRAQQRDIDYAAQIINLKP